MIKAGSIVKFPKDIKALIAIFLLVLSVGFISALQFVNLTTDANPTGIQENYLGNELDIDATTLKFEKTEMQILNIIHTHILAMSLIFFSLALLVATTNLNGFWRKFLMYEPLLTVLVTFGSIYLLWKVFTIFRYLIMISGFLMTISFIASVIVILLGLIKRDVSSSPGSSPIMKKVL